MLRFGAPVNLSKPFVLACCLAGCVHSGPAIDGPEGVARSYARALDEGRLDDAWALSAPLDRAQFGERYTDLAVAKRRAAEVTRAAQGQAIAAVALEVTGKGWRVIEAAGPAAPLADEQQARALVAHFLAAIDGGDFETVFGDLSAAWRGRYTPARLKADFSSEPAAVARLQRIRAALAGRWEVTLAGPQLPVGEGKLLRLVREGGALKVAAIE